MPIRPMGAPHGADPTLTRQNVALQKAAHQLEAQFLAEMLKSSDAGMPSTFGGGAGEDQFQSFLRDAQADRMVAGGGIGLAESIFDSLTQRIAK